MALKDWIYMTTHLCAASSLIGSATPLRYEVLSRAGLQPYTAQLTSWRATLFSEYPYLFKPSDTQDHAAAGEASLPVSTMVGAFKGETLVGCLVGMPLSQYHDTSKDCYAADNTLRIIQEKYPHAFFINELFIDPAHRSYEIMQGLYETLEQMLRKLHPGCTMICLLKIDDALDHPLRPQNYEQTLTTERIEYALVTTYGFTKTGDMVNIAWSTITPDGSLALEEHTVHAWCKTL